MGILRVAIGIAVLALCFAGVLVVSAAVGGWYAYWGAFLLSGIWAGVLLWLRTTEFWEGE